MDRTYRIGHYHDNHSHNEHHIQMVQDFKFHFWCVLALTTPIMVLFPMIQEYLGIDWRFTADKWILAVLTIIDYFFGMVVSYRAG